MIVKEEYSPNEHPSRHTTESVPMTGIEFQKLFLRFKVGRATADDWGRWVYNRSMSAADFYNLNHIQLIEASE